ENMVSTVLSEQNKLFPLLKKNTNEIEKKIDLKINEIEQEIIDEIERYFLMEHFYTHVCAALDSSKRLSKIKKYFTMELPDLLKSEKFVIENNVIVEIFKESVKESKHWWGVSVPELREILKHKLYIIFHEKF
ncbi:MAG: hypothetical protein J7K39_01120, partial [Bacteroidales bacterium]|nr:hypothetical protein [Bacteroidales bacterium]